MFDANFIERNVHSGGVVSTNQRKNLLEFALGEPAVAARAAVDKATTDAKNASDNIQVLVSQLLGFHPAMTLVQFEKLAAIPDADKQLAALQTREIGVRLQLNRASMPLSRISKNTPHILSRIV